jgi:hypothetical protein
VYKRNIIVVLYNICVHFKGFQPLLRANSACMCVLGIEHASMSRRLSSRSSPHSTPHAARIPRAGYQLFSI